jgi:hypothetical protein
VFDRKKSQHTFGDSAAEKIWFHNRFFDFWMGSQCDIDKKNVIMVNIEELNEEDQRKYTELQEYIKQQFLSGARKDRSGKVTLNQDFELPAIKLNKDKVEVIPTVSQASPPDLVTQLTAITDRFERAFNDQSSLVASVVTRLEKIEGERVINISNDGIPQVDSHGVLHSTTSVAQEASPEVPLYGMLMGSYPEQSPLPKRTPGRPPPGRSNRPVWPDGHGSGSAVAFVGCAWYIGLESK